MLVHMSAGIEISEVGTTWVSVDMTWVPVDKTWVPVDKTWVYAHRPRKRATL